MAEFIRVWKELELNDVSEHLLIVGVTVGDCSKCRALGIEYSTAKACPKCGTDFKYAASRTKEIRKIKNKRPDLIFIDFEDYTRVTSQIKARKFFTSDSH